MDIIVLGRPGFKSTDKPQLVYLGDSRSEAKQAALATGDKFAWIYEVNGMILRNYKTDRRKAAAPQPATATEAPKAEPKRTKKSL